MNTCRLAPHHPMTVSLSYFEKKEILLEGFEDGEKRVRNVNFVHLKKHPLKATGS